MREGIVGTSGEGAGGRRGVVGGSSVSWHPGVAHTLRVQMAQSRRDVPWHSGQGVASRHVTPPCAWAHGAPGIDQLQPSTSFAVVISCLSSAEATSVQYVQE